MATATTYDRTYLTDTAKVKNLATWVLSSSSPVAEAARRAMRTQANQYPSQNALRMVYGYLFSQECDPAVLVRAYCTSQR